MGFYKTGLAEIVAGINAANPRAGVQENQLLPPIGIEPYTPKEGEPEECNTRCWLQARDGAGIRGGAYVYFHRIPLEDLLKPGDEFQVQGHPNTPAELYTLLQSRYGLDFSAEDTDCTELTYTQEGFAQVFLTAHATNERFIGTLPVSVVPSDIDIAEVVVVPLYEDFQYPSGQAVTPQAQVYSFGWDATPWRSWAGQVKTNQTLTATDARALKDISGDPWTMEPGEFSLYGARVVYAGYNNAQLPTNPNYERVLFIELAAECTNLAGMLQIHFNMSNQENWS